jgi:hypothetical protein
MRQKKIRAGKKGSKTANKIGRAKVEAKLGEGIFY